jgi:5-methylcytosine-specific restriction enzyme subunit McrC
MATSIPIENLYYLLSYAWDHYAEGDEVDVSSDACPDLPNLLGRVLANGIRRLSRTGFEQQYLPHRETTSRLRGRILVAESHRRLTHRRAQMECEFDELHGDTPANRILRSTCDRLLRLSELTVEVRHEVRLARGLLPEATPVKITDAAFHRIQLHRNTRRYRLLLSVCRLIHRGLLPEERQGSRRFRDILRDEVTMHRLFEGFVLNFARRHCPGANVRAMPIDWVGEWDAVAAQVLPKMITDVTIEWPDRKVILDCKFYKEALVTRNDRHRLHSGHLYQLNAYLQNKAHEPGWEEAEGVLLYPAVKHKLDVRLRLLGHRFRIVSIDLDRHWSEIEEGLVSVLGPVMDAPSVAQTEWA